MKTKIELPQGITTFTIEIVDGKPVIEYSEEKVKWTPKKGETYCFINSLIEIDYYNNHNDATDEAIINIGNCFKSKEEAEKHLPAFKELITNFFKNI